MNRRDFSAGIIGGLLAAQTMSEALAQNAPTASSTPAPAPPRLQVGAFIYPNMIMLDLVGPQTAFALTGSDVHLVALTKAPVATDIGIAVTPTMSIDECPPNLDILFVPGGLGGTIPMMDNQAALDFLADRGSRARYVTSVCTGSLLLAAAGLLKGYKATSHWYVRDLLPLMGAQSVHERFVVDRNRITGGGVTAGIDAGLEIVRQIRGDDTARFVQLVLEYDPKPPLSAGSPESAGPALTNSVLQIRNPVLVAARQAAERAGKRLGG